MTTVSDLLYRLRADGSQINRELGGARRAFDAFGKRARASINRAGEALGLLGTGVGALTKSAIDSIDNLQKLADASGLAAEDMGGLQLAADLGGSSIERIGNAAGRMSRSMRDGAKVFDELKIKVRDANGALRPTIDVMGDVADRIQTLGPGAESTAIAMEIFGRAGQDLLPTLLQGSEGLEKMREEADALGLTFDENTGRAAEQFNDNLSRMQARLKGIFRQVAGEMLPVLNSYSKSLATSSTQTGFLSSVTGGLVFALRGVLSVGEGAVAAFNGLGLSLGALGAAFVEATTSLAGEALAAFRALSTAASLAADRDFAGARDALAGYIDGSVARAEASRARMAAIWDGWGDDIERIVFDTGGRLEAIWSESIEQLQPPEIKPPTIPRGITDEVKKTGKEVADLADIVADAFDDAQKVVDRFWDSLESEGARVFERTRTPLETFNIEVARLSELLNYGVISSDTYLRAVDQLAEGLNKVEKQTKKTGKALENIGEQAARRLASELSSVLFDPFERRTDEMVEQFARAMAKMAFEAAASALIGQVFGAAGGSSAPGFAAGGMVRGPGTGTSDSIIARLSDGEFVVRQRAVDHYGAPFLAALNNLDMPRSRFAEGGQASGGEPAVNLTVANLFSEEELERYLSSRAGERVIMNALRRTGHS